MKPLELINSMMQESSGTVSRSTLHQPLLWFIGILASALALAATQNAPQWVLIILAVLFVLSAVIFLSFFTYFAIKNPDQNRTEKFVITKLAIERNLFGDSVAGLREIVGEPKELVTADEVGKGDVE